MGGTLIAISLGMICCLWIAIEDFRSRRISVWALGGFALVGVIVKYLAHGWSFLSDLWSNILILFFILLCIQGYYWLKERQMIFDTKLGWGDISFLGGLAIWLSPIEFVWFFSISTLLITTFFVIALMSKRITDQYPIPLAGLQSAGFLIFFPLSHFYLQDIFWI